MKAFSDVGSGEGGKVWIGSKVRRKEASLLRCLIVKDIFESLDDAIEQFYKGHNDMNDGREEGCL